LTKINRLGVRDLCFSIRKGDFSGFLNTEVAGNTVTLSIFLEICIFHVKQLSMWYRNSYRAAPLHPHWWTLSMSPAALASSSTSSLFDMHLTIVESMNFYARIREELQRGIKPICMLGSMSVRTAFLVAFVETKSLLYSLAIRVLGAVINALARYHTFSPGLLLGSVPRI